MKQKILKFRATSGFGKWQKHFPEESVAHPAKINLHLLNYLIQTYTEEGNTILDPMAGTGSTIVLSVLNNRNAIGVELEKKFVGWATQAVETVEKEQTLTPKGKGTVICGDSRKLTEVLNDHEEEISSVLFSPPYGQVQKGGGIAIKGYEGKYGKDENLHLRHDRPLSEDERNISNLPFNVDCVVASPPYAQSTSPFVRGAPLEDEEDLPIIGCLNIQDGYSESMCNIGNLPFLAAILFSPPYFSSISAETDADKRLERLERGGYLDSKEWQRPNSIKTVGRDAMFSKNNYSDDAENIGNIKDFGIDVVLSSPPYEESLGAKHHSPRADALAAEKSNPSTYTQIDESVSRLREHGRSDGKAGGAFGKSLGHPYSPSEANIGNQKKESYLEAMKTVYEQCFLVLKPQGLLILVLKNFIRDKKVVPLTEHTVKLCESVGFKLKERLLFKLPTQSFWRRLYSQKYPEVDTTDLRFEHILILEKENF